MKEFDLQKLKILKGLLKPSMIYLFTFSCRYYNILYKFDEINKSNFRTNENNNFNISYPESQTNKQK